ncbi:DUF2510 domain-containing protein [Microbacterium foliorum]
MSTTYPAGWYPDANYPGYERYYDGVTWTEHTRAVAVQPTQVLPQHTRAYPYQTQAHYQAQQYPQQAYPYTVAPTPVAEAQPPKNKGAKIPLIILGSVVGGILFLSFIGAVVSGGSDRDRPTADEPVAAQTTPEPTPTPDEAEAAPQAVEEAPPAPPTADGSVANPFPAPYTVTGFFGAEKYTFTGRVTNADATAAVKEWNMFNDDAPAGYKYVIAEVTMTGLDSDGTEPRYDQYDVQLATSEGNGYDNEIIVFPEGSSSFWDGPTLYPGQSFTGLMAFIVPADATAFLFKVDGDYVASAG